VKRTRWSLIVCVMAVSAGAADAQSAPDRIPADSLYQIIASLDSAMFHAYNTCDLERLATYFEEDLEFYHDQTGLSRGRQSLLSRATARSPLESIASATLGSTSTAPPRAARPGT
jgi:hypothetical protein